MGKDNFLTPKAIANRMKAKGLQKLRWYCEMCQKQCRDENGFKCHLLSESHNRQMHLFVENPDKYLDEFSEEFQTEFLKLLRRRFGTRRVGANLVYQEYISDKQHVHMNATRWSTLTEFVKHLGRESLCEVSETEKGWFIQYIDRDPEVMARAEAAARQERLAKDEEERARIELQRQIERAQRDEITTAQPVYTELATDSTGQVHLALPKVALESAVLLKPVNALEKLLSSDAVAAHPNAPSNSNGASSVSTTNGRPAASSTGAINTPLAVAHVSAGEKKKRTALDEIMEQEEQKKSKMNRKDYWLVPGIVVKVRNKKIANGQYDGKKGVVTTVIEKYVGEIEMIDSGDVIRVDQAHCETVLPTFGGRLHVVNGAYRGEQAVLLGINADDYCSPCFCGVGRALVDFDNQASIRIVHGPYNERVVDRVPYEDICKTAA